MRARLLAHIGIDRYVVRVPAVRHALPRLAVVTEAAPLSSKDVVSVAGGSGVYAMVFVCDAAEAGPDPAAGRYGKLLGHVALALGMRLDQVAFAARADHGPALCFGAATGDSPEARLAPTLATLRGSARARRALWQDLRDLRKSRA
jgi:hypothetical protein